MHSFESTWQGYSLPIDLANFTDNAQDDRRQGTICCRVVVLARTILQRRTPEGRNICRHEPIAFVTMFLPVRYLFDLLLPQFQHNWHLPNTLAKCYPGSARRGIRQAYRFQCRKQRTSVWQKCAAD